MEKSATKTLDRGMTKLLAAGAPHRIGLPTWLTKHVLTRPDYPHTVNSILGIPDNNDPENLPIDLLDDFDDRLGYQFDWGSISEHYLLEEDKDPGDVGNTVFFEVLPERLLLADPDPAFWEDWMIEMYSSHRLASDEFCADEAIGSFHTLMFTACGEEETARLRAFLAKTFVPRILPDLLSAAHCLLDETANDPDAKSTTAASLMLGLGDDDDDEEDETRRPTPTH